MSDNETFHTFSRSLEEVKRWDMIWLNTLGKDLTRKLFKLIEDNPFDSGKIVLFHGKPKYAGLELSTEWRPILQDVEVIDVYVVDVMDDIINKIKDDEAREAKGTKEDEEYNPF